MRKKPYTTRGLARVQCSRCGGYVRRGCGIIECPHRKKINQRRTGDGDDVRDTAVVVAVAASVLDDD